MAAHDHNLEPIEPRTALDLFLDHKEANHAAATVRNYRYRINHFIQWCEENNVKNLNDISGRDLQSYRLWRKEQSDLNKLTMRMQMGTLRVFLKWAGSIEAVPENLFDKLIIPRVRPEDRQRDEILDAERAQKVISFLSKFEYASREHVLMALLWETGLRIGAVKSLDVDDVDFDNLRLSLVHRPDQGTQLKNGSGGERLVALSDELANVLGDYVDNIRLEVNDEYSRQPLFTTRHGRMARGTMRCIVYRVTAPCFFDEPYYDCSEGGDTRCGDSVSPHSIRRGSITHFLTNDVPVDVISDWMNVSRKVLEKHYDKRSEEIKVEQRRDYIERI